MQVFVIKNEVQGRGKSGPADAISVPADSASEIVKFTISIPRESCTNAKAKYSSSVVPPDPSVHFYHWFRVPKDWNFVGVSESCSRPERHRPST